MRNTTTSPNGLTEILDRLLDARVVVAGQLQISLAEVELIELDLRLLLTGSASQEQRSGMPRRRHEMRPSRPLPSIGPAPSLPRRIDGGKRGDDGIARLVLVLVELLREVLASQAIARVESGSLTDEEVDRLGRALMLLEQRCDALRDFLRTDESWRPLDPPTQRSSR